MPVAPDLDAVDDYLGTDHSFTEDEITTARSAEIVAQLHVCHVPGEDADPYPDDLGTALCRRVARHLNLKYKPLGYEPGLDGGLSYISANDSEIRRLEAPYRKRAVR